MHISSRPVYMNKKSSPKTSHQPANQLSMCDSLTKRWPYLSLSPACCQNIISEYVQSPDGMWSAVLCARTAKLKSVLDLFTLWFHHREILSWTGWLIAARTPSVVDNPMGDWDFNSSVLLFTDGPKGICRSCVGCLSFCPYIHMDCTISTCKRK